jgi:hypothetical protein
MPGTPFEVLGVKGELHPINRTNAEATGARDYDDPDVPFSARTAYAVVVDGERIGVVSSKRGTSHRKAGRLITRTFHPTEWVGTLTGERHVSERCVGDWYRLRADATRGLVEAWRDA